MIGVVTLISMVFGSALVPIDDPNETDQDDDAPPESDHTPEAMIDGGLLADAYDMPEPPMEPEFDDDRPTQAAEITPDVPTQPEEPSATSGAEPLPFVLKSTQDDDEADRGNGKGKGLIKDVVDVTTDVVDPDDPFAGLTGNELVKALRAELKASKGLLDKDTLKALRKELQELKGSDDGNVLTADDAGSWVEGLKGSDRLVGGAGSDLLEGGDDNDSLRATEGGDVMMGGGGSDVLIGVESSYDPALGLHQFIHGQSGSSEDVLDGGEGDDVLRMGRGDVGIGGSGADLFFVQGDMDDPHDDIVPVIDDYDGSEDTLVIAIPFTEAELIESWPHMPDRSYDVEAVDFEDGTGATIYVNGAIMAHVTGAQGINPDDIRVVGNEMVGANAFDISHGVQATDTWWRGIEEDATAQRLIS